MTVGKKFVSGWQQRKRRRRKFLQARGRITYRTRSIFAGRRRIRLRDVITTRHDQHTQTRRGIARFAERINIHFDKCHVINATHARPSRAVPKNNGSCCLRLISYSRFDAPDPHIRNALHAVNGDVDDDGPDDRCRQAWQKWGQCVHAYNTAADRPTDRQRRSTALRSNVYSVCRSGWSPGLLIVLIVCFFATACNADPSPCRRGPRQCGGCIYPSPSPRARARRRPRPIFPSENRPHAHERPPHSLTRRYIYTAERVVTTKAGCRPKRRSRAFTRTNRRNDVTHPNARDGNEYTATIPSGGTFNNRNPQLSQTIPRSHDRCSTVRMSHFADIVATDNACLQFCLAADASNRGGGYGVYSVHLKP